MAIKKRIVLEGPAGEAVLGELLAAARGLGYTVIEAADANDDGVTVTARNMRLSELPNAVILAMREQERVGLGCVDDVARLSELEVWRRLNSTGVGSDFGVIAAHMAANGIEFADVPATPCSDAYAVFQRNGNILPELADLGPGTRGPLGRGGVLHIRLLEQLTDADLTSVRWINSTRLAIIRTALAAYHAQRQA